MDISAKGDAMTKTTWISKIARTAALAAGTLAFAGALGLASTRSASAQLARADGTASRRVGRVATLCSAFDGQHCNFNGTQVHCTTQNGGPGRCLCFENEWSCNF